MRHVYHHTFRNGVRATATLTDDPPGYAVRWHGRPSRGILGEYLQWRATVLAEFAGRTGQKILVVDMT